MCQLPCTATSIQSKWGLLFVLGVANLFEQFLRLLLFWLVLCCGTSSGVYSLAWHACRVLLLARVQLCCMLLGGFFSGHCCAQIILCSVTTILPCGTRQSNSPLLFVLIMSPAAALRHSLYGACQTIALGGVMLASNLLGGCICGNVAADAVFGHCCEMAAMRGAWTWLGFLRHAQVGTRHGRCWKASQQVCA